MGIEGRYKVESFAELCPVQCWEEGNRLLVACPFAQIEAESV